MTTHPNRRVITFYAFKGGVGRTMTLANVAFRLADRHGLRVIAVDFDLEAPGLHSFFELPPEKVEQSPGVLDYCEAWEKALRENAPSPPDPLSYLLPIEEGPGKPGLGSLRLLLAGRQDVTYDARLGRFDWKRFYAESAGAGALEHLRNTLAEHADVILIDSRTGLTDPGGICTIQIPDAVVLMTAPNKQSIEGIERVARSIADATPEQRGGRSKATSFLCMSRVPIVEETFLAQQWFGQHQKWFQSGVNAGLWEDGYPGMGLQTHVIPQRAFYGFGEAIVGRAEGTLAREPLAQAYDGFTAFLFIWMMNTQGAASKTIKRVFEDRAIHFRNQAEHFSRSAIALARAEGSLVIEAQSTRQLLAFANDRGKPLPDEPALRQRLAEIEAQPEAPTPPKPKRKRTKKST